MWNKSHVPPKKHIKKKQLARLNNLNPLIKHQVEKKQSVYLWNQQKSLEKNPLNFPGIFSRISSNHRRDQLYQLATVDPGVKKVSNTKGQRLQLSGLPWFTWNTKM